MGDRFHFVFAAIDSARCPVGFVVVHGIAHGETAHEIGNAWLWYTQIFAQNEAETIGEEEESVGGDGGGPKVRGVAFVDNCLRGETFDPGERGGVGEAEVV